MGNQRKMRPMLEPVLENYMGPPVYDTRPEPCQRSVSPCKKAESAKPQKSSKGRRVDSFSPMNILGRLRDRYVKLMNEMAMGGDLTGAAGYHGCVAGPDYPGATMEHGSTAKERELELEALRQELAMLEARNRKGQSTA